MIAGDQIRYSNDRHNTTTKDDCRGSDTLLKWQTWHHYKGMPGIRYVTQMTDMTPLQRNAGDQIRYSNDRHNTTTKIGGDQICYSNDRHNTTTKDCRGSDMLLKWQTWHHYKGMPGIRYVTQMTDITPLLRLAGIRCVTQMTDITPLQRIAGGQIRYSNDRHNTTTKDDCRGSDTLLKWQT